MPNFFTMKLRGGLQVPDNRQKVTAFISQKNCVGIGDPQYTTGAGTFQNDIQKGDVIVLRAGGRPLALLEVTSDCYQYNADGTFPEFDEWLMFARNIKILSWYDEVSGIYFDARGFLQACAAITGAGLTVAQKWYEIAKENSNCVRY